jgi:hypothetical protein
MEPDRTLDDFGFGSIRASGHATESTVLDLFNKELSKKVKVLTQMSYPQLSGRKPYLQQEVKYRSFGAS